MFITACVEAFRRKITIRMNYFGWFSFFLKVNKWKCDTMSQPSIHANCILEWQASKLKNQFHRIIANHFNLPNYFAFYLCVCLLYALHLLLFRYSMTSKLFVNEFCSCRTATSTLFEIQPSIFNTQKWSLFNWQHRFIFKLYIVQ